MMRNLKSATTCLLAIAAVGAFALNAPATASAQSETPVSEKNLQQEASEQAPLRPGVVTLKTSSSDSLANAEAQVKLDEANRIILAVSKYVAAAKKDYSPRYGARTGAAREQLVSQLRDYVKYAETPGHEDAKALATKLQIPALIKLSAESPTIFRGRLAAVRDALGDYARSSKKNVEREKSLAVLTDYYLAVFKASDAAPLEAAVAGSDAEYPDEELEREKRECFEFYGDALCDAVRAYFSSDSDGSIDQIVRAIGEMRYYQSESPSVSRLAGYLHDVFSGANFYLEASEKFLSAFTYRDVSETFNVNETIRGARAQGVGALKGHTVLDVKPSESRALMALVLNANVSTRTVGASKGVFVHTDNLGAVAASKPMFLNSDGRITTSAAAANANMRTTLRGVNTDRITLFGGKIIQNKVSQELPASERDGAERIKARVARELDAQANAQILEMNRRIEHMEIGSANSMIQNLKSRTSEDRFFIECVLGRGLQFSAPGAVAASARPARQTSVASGSSDEVVERGAAKPVEPGLFRNVRGGALTTLAPNLRNSVVMSASSNTILPRLDALRPFRPVASETTAESAPRPDLFVRFHESAPNNAATIALAGALFGPGYDTLDNVILRFPGVDPDDIKKLLAPYEPQGVRELDPDDHAQKVFIRFDEVQPFSTRFENDAITTVLRVSSCDVDGKEWGPIEVRMIYRLEIRDDRFVFVRDELEVLPGGYQDGDPVSARFYTFRRIFIKRLETTINEEYVFSPLPVDTIAALENRGSLRPKKVEAQDGWLTVEFDLDPIKDEGKE